MYITERRMKQHKNKKRVKRDCRDCQCFFDIRLSDRLTQTHILDRLFKTSKPSYNYSCTAVPNLETHKHTQWVHICFSRTFIAVCSRTSLWLPISMRCALLFAAWPLGLFARFSWCPFYFCAKHRAKIYTFVCDVLTILAFRASR